MASPLQRFSIRTQIFLLTLAIMLPVAALLVWLLAAGVPQAAVFADFDATLGRVLVIGLGMLLLALLLAWRIGAAIVRPIVDLAGTAADVAAGSRAIRVSLAGPADAASVAQQFNRMLDARDASERAVRESEARFRSLTELSADWYWEQDRDMRLSFHSSGFDQRSGTTSDKLLGKLRWEEHDRIPLNSTWDEHRATLEARLPFRGFEYVRIGHDGERHFVSLSGVPIFDAAGNFNGYRGVGRNITERKQAEAALRESEKRYRTLIEWTPEAIAVHRDGKLLYVNPAAIRMFGASCAQELVGRSILDMVHPDFHRIVLARLAAVSEHGVSSAPVVDKFLRLDGAAIDVEVTGTSIDYDGKPARHVAMRDITARIRLETQNTAERKVLELAAGGGSQSEVLTLLVLGYEALFPGMRGSVLLLDPDGRHLRHGAAPNLPRTYCAAIDGIEIGPQVGSCGTAAHSGKTTLVADIASDPLWRDFKDLAQEHGLRACWSVPILGTSGRVLGTFAFYFGAPRAALPAELVSIERGANLAGLTIERCLAETALRESETRFKALTELSADWFWEQDQDFRFTQMTGPEGSDPMSTPTAHIGKTRWELPSVHMDAALWQRHREQLQRHETFRNFEITRQEPDGSLSWYVTAGSPRFDAQGCFLGYRGVGTDITERKRAEAALAAKTELLRDTFDNMGEGISIVDRDLRLAGWNRRFATLLGLPDSLLHANTTFADVIRFNALRGEYGPGDPEEQVRKRVELAARFEAHRIERTRPDGIVLEIRGSPLPGGGFVTTYTDITERKHAESTVSKAAQRLEIALEGSQISVWETDLRTNEVWLDAAWATYLGNPAAETRSTAVELLALVHPEDQQGVVEAAVRTMKGEISSYAIDHRVKAANGEWRWILSRGRIVERDTATGRPLRMSGTNTDITERKNAEEKINALAFFDQLTGLPNRTLLRDRLNQVVVASSRSGSYGALLFIDLDDFKTLNDTLGHDTGDMLLRQVAQRLTLCVREVDTVARFGGDEFVVVLAGLSTNQADAAVGTEIVADKILASLTGAYTLGGVTHHSTASIGVTLFKDDTTTVDDLMKQADLAMYKSKEAGRNAWRFFDPHMESAVKQRATLENDLRQALAEDQFLLHFQAQIAGDGVSEPRVTGAEVLIRWRHPRRGMVSPAEFVPLAEEIGMILPLGHWVLETACMQLTRWSLRAEMAHLTIAVNVSAHQIRHPDFVEQVLGVLASTGANPQRLKLELTESLLVHNIQDIIGKMTALQAKGVGFSLDDFGTGYSSLSYLSRLPLDSLKIDQSFVRGVLTDPNDAAIARTVVALAHNLGLGVIAEGVETEAQRDFLAGSGCYAYQGYFFSRPAPVEGFEAYTQQI